MWCIKMGIQLSRNTEKFTPPPYTFEELHKATIEYHKIESEYSKFLYVNISGYSAREIAEHNRKKAELHALKCAAESKFTTMRAALVDYVESY